MTIYNRWGQEIFQTLNLNGRGWDGKFNDKEQPMDVYIYVIDLTMKNGYKEHYQGNVTLLR
jgi:gliding motility-associated-like protein